MTEPDDTPGAARAGDAADALLDHAVALRRWSAVVDAAASATAPLLAALPDAWTDAAGREWTERLHLVRAELARRAEEALDLARDAERAATAPPGTGDPAGVHLGALTGTRTPTRRGVVVPVLPPP